VAITLAAYVVLYLLLIVAYVAVLKYLAEHPAQAKSKPPMHSSAAVAEGTT
jgi:cytochrome bd-type quinol oxidase subunit 1